MESVEILGFEVTLEDPPGKGTRIADLSDQLNRMLQSDEFQRCMYDDPAQIVQLVYRALVHLCDGGDLYLVGLDGNDQFRNIELWEHIDAAAARVNEASRRGRAAGIAQSVLLYLFPEPMDSSQVASMAAVTLAMLPNLGLHIDGMQAVEAAVLARVERSGRDYNP